MTTRLAPRTDADARPMNADMFLSVQFSGFQLINTDGYLGVIVPRGCRLYEIKFAVSDFANGGNAAITYRPRKVASGTIPSASGTALGPSDSFTLAAGADIKADTVTLTDDENLLCADGDIVYLDIDTADASDADDSTTLYMATFCFGPEID